MPKARHGKELKVDELILMPILLPRLVDRLDLFSPLGASGYF
jgi:hypothetical protein